MKQWKNIINTVIEHGVDIDDRTGTGTRSFFGVQQRWNMGDGFPAVTTKKLAFRSAIGELLWFIEGSTNVNRLREITYGKDSDKMTVWDDNYNNQAKALGYTDGELGPVYGAQWRGTDGGVDQLFNAIEAIKNNSSAPSRRIIVDSWNPSKVDKMGLPPCHYSFQFDVCNGKLSLLWIQRSVDVFLGLPFNIASYATLLHIVSIMCDLEPGELVLQGGNTHIYSNHMEQCKEILRREEFSSPKLKINLADEFKNWSTKKQLDYICHMSPDDFELIGYKSHDKLKGKMAI